MKTHTAPWDYSRKVLLPTPPDGTCPKCGEPAYISALPGNDLLITCMGDCRNYRLSAMTAETVAEMRTALAEVAETLRTQNYRRFYRQGTSASRDTMAAQLKDSGYGSFGPM
jgi:hypothetical protein